MPAGDVLEDTDRGGLAGQLLGELQLVVMSAAPCNLVEMRTGELKAVTNRSPFLLTHLLYSSFAFPPSAVTEQGAV